MIKIPMTSPNGKGNATLWFACHRCSSRSITLLWHDKGHSLFYCLFRSILMMHRIHPVQLLLPFVRFVKLSHVLLPNYHILRAVKEENGKIQQIQMHDKVCLENTMTNELLHLTLNEVKDYAHQEWWYRFIVMLCNIQHNLHKGRSTCLSLRKGVSRTRQATFLGWSEAYIMAKEAPMLRPHNVTFFILYFFCAYSKTQSISFASF